MVPLGGEEFLLSMTVKEALSCSHHGATIVSTFFHLALGHLHFVD